MSESIEMPLMTRWPAEWRGFPVESVLIPMDRDRQARANHGGQTLVRLKQRGGLGPDEAIALLEKREWRRMTPDEAIVAIEPWVNSQSEQRP